MYPPSNWRPDPDTLNASTADQAGDEPEPDATVNQWRLDSLKAAGWPELEAMLLAVDHGIDLHHACALLESGCDLATAWEILS